MTGSFTLAGLLLRGRAAAGRATVDVLTIVTFMISTSLLLSVVAGARALSVREQNPPAGFLAALGASADLDVTMMGIWTFLAFGAAVLLVVPLLTLSAAAARMGALGRDQRLATLRLLGVSVAGVIRLAALETMMAAGLGAICGIAGYFGLLPALSMIRFQTAPLSGSELVLPAGWIAAVVVVVVALAGAASLSGLREVTISPLGVSKRERRRGVPWKRIIAVPVVVVVWLAVSPFLSFQREWTTTIVVVLVVLGAFMGVVNLIGPLVLQLAGRVLVRFPSATAMLAGRRVLDDPRGAWRNVAGLAFTGFIGGAFVAMPSFRSQAPFVTILSADLRTGTLMTVVIAFVTAAASTALNQAAAVLDRRRALVQLDHAGASRSVINGSRRREVLVPTLCASVGSAALAVLFFLVLGRVAQVDADPAGLITLAAIVVAGVALVVAASESCRPIVRGVLATAGARVE